MTTNSCVSMQVSGKGLRELVSLQHLARLSLKCCTNVNDQALKAVGQITSLTCVLLPSSHTQVCLSSLSGRPMSTCRTLQRPLTLLKSDSWCLLPPHLHPDTHQGSLPLCNSIYRQTELVPSRLMPAPACCSQALHRHLERMYTRYVTN